MEAAYDGTFLNKYVNRRVSEPIARILAKTWLTPNQVSWAAFGTAILSFISFVLGQNVVGGLLVQLSSIVDGVGGGLAHLKGMSSDFGGFLDSVLDRYVDILVVLGLTLWSVSHETYPGIWLASFAAITGSLCIAHARADIASEHRYLFDKGLSSFAAHDIRLFLIMLGAVTGQAYFCLIVIAALTNLVVLYRLIYCYRYLRRETK